MGAQDGVVGLWHFQRWCAILAYMVGLLPLYETNTTGCKAGGIGGSATPIGMAEMPVGIAGAHGICRLVILEDPSEKAQTPPLVPTELLKEFDSVIEPKTEFLSLRISGGIDQDGYSALRTSSS